MSQVSITWKKVSFVDLSGIEEANYFALSNKDEVFLLKDIDGGDAFTKITQALSIYSLDLREIDIWVGLISDKSESEFVKLDHDEMCNILDWTTKLDRNMEEKNPVFNVAG